LIFGNYYRSGGHCPDHSESGTGSECICGILRLHIGNDGATKNIIVYFDNFGCGKRLLRPALGADLGCNRRCGSHDSGSQFATNTHAMSGSISMRNMDPCRYQVLSRLQKHQGNICIIMFYKRYEKVFIYP